MRGTADEGLDFQNSVIWLWWLVGVLDLTLLSTIISLGIGSNLLCLCLLDRMALVGLRCACLLLPCLSGKLVLK